MNTTKEPAVKAVTTTPSDREIRMERIFNAPHERVWKAMTTPELLARWWGRGNKIVLERFEFERGGHWRFVEHSEQGTEGFDGRFGEISPIDRIVTLPMCCTARFEVHVTLIRPALVAGPVTVHDRVPEPLALFARFAAMLVHVAPPSRLMSMSTASSCPRLWVHLMTLTVPISQRAETGAVTLMLGGSTRNVTLLRSPLAGLPARLTRTNACAVMTDGTVTSWDPVSAVADGTPVASELHVAPFSPLKSKSNV